MMERVRSLIEQLNRQFSQKAPPNQLLTTVQMLQKEIMGSIREVDVLGADHISVIVPNIRSLHPAVPFTETRADEVREKEYEKEYFELVPDGNADEDLLPEGKNEIPSYEELLRIQKEIEGQPGLTGATLSFTTDHEPETDEDTPTLARQGKAGGMKAAKQTAVPKVSRNAIKDLNKAIGAQDRIVFVRELFRGDEIMFERSIKTINSFNALADAEYWIQRELTTKNGWLAGDPVVQRFEQFIKRRFA